MMRATSRTFVSMAIIAIIGSAWVAAGARGAAKPLGMVPPGDSIALVALQKGNATAVVDPEDGVLLTIAANSKPTNVAFDRNQEDVAMVLLRSPASILVQSEAGPGGSMSVAKLASKTKAKTPYMEKEVHVRRATSSPCFAGMNTK